MGTFGVPQCPQCPVHCNIGIRKFRWMTFHFLIRCKGGSVQTSEIPYGMYNYEWNSHLMGRFLLNISAIIWIAFVLLLSFSLLLVPVILHVFPHYYCIFYHHLKSHVFPQAVFLMPRSTVWCPKDRKRFWPKRRPENHHLKLSTRNFRDVGIFPPAGDIEHCGLGLFSTAFLGCRDPWEEGAGKRKICEKTPVRCAKDLGILDIVLISLSSWFKVLE